MAVNGWRGLLPFPGGSGPAAMSGGAAKRSGTVPGLLSGMRCGAQGRHLEHSRPISLTTAFALPCPWAFR